VTLGPGSRASRSAGMTDLGAMVWGGLYLRDARLRALIPFR
jgi:hypothetical protein